MIRLLLLFCFLGAFSGYGAPTGNILAGAQRMDAYLSDLQGRNVGVVANHTSLVGSRHLVDTLLACGVSVHRIMSPEHGFRGTAEAGEHVDNGLDRQTGIPVVSLYGSHREPTPEDLKNLDVVVFDLQDTGTRFYTYISTLHYVLAACARQNIPVVLLDRPNPNGHYVDGPVLDTVFRSFVGMHPVPVVYGMTIGEYGRMILGEGWLGDGLKANLRVIPCLGYTHRSTYELPVPPSPNLRSMKAIYLYPSLCFFEGTTFSVGRGTSKPFMVFGHPDFPEGSYWFTPVSLPGIAANPPHMGVRCRGTDLSGYETDSLRNVARLDLSWIINTYRRFPDKKNFFNTYFDTLAGGNQLRLQIEGGWSEDKIRKSWTQELAAFRQIRKKYLLYPD
jgi:uncharacterized protein YbbC (DUF1343 family)